MNHDESYRSLFASPPMVRALMERFIDPRIVERLDLTGLQREETSMQTPDLSRRETDMVWRVPLKEPGAAPLYVLLMLEFQSSHDRLMALRFLVYGALLMLDGARRESRAEGARHLPHLFPLVIYNGQAPWSAAVTIEALRAPLNDPILAPYQPQLRYAVIDVRRLAPHEVEGAEPGEEENVAALFFALEHATEVRAPHRIAALLDRLERALDKNEEMRHLKRVFVAWISQAFDLERSDVSVRQLDSMMEVKDMIAENWKKFLQSESDRLRRELTVEITAEVTDKVTAEVTDKVTAEIAQRARRESLSEALLSVLEARFGEREGRRAQLDSLSVTQLKDLLSHGAKAPSEEEAFEAVLSEGR